MALITCPECNNQISETAESCPKCGRKIIPGEAKRIKEKAKKDALHGGMGCLAIIIIIFLFVYSSNSSDGKGNNEKTFKLSDGTTIALTNIEKAKDYMCGKREVAVLKSIGHPNHLDGVNLYYYNNKLISIRVPKNGNTSIYEKYPNKSCVMNWKTNKFDMLTDKEYKNLEKKYMNKKNKKK